MYVNYIQTVSPILDECTRFEQYHGSHRFKNVLKPEHSIDCLLNGIMCTHILKADCDTTHSIHFSSVNSQNMTKTLYETCVKVFVVHMFIWGGFFFCTHTKCTLS